MVLTPVLIDVFLMVHGTVSEYSLAWVTRSERSNLYWCLGQVFSFILRARFAVLLSLSVFGKSCAPADTLSAHFWVCEGRSL